jgi:hypothetical protein
MYPQNSPHASEQPAFPANQVSDPGHDLTLPPIPKVTRESLEEDKKKLFPELFESKPPKVLPRDTAKRSIRRRQQRRRARGGGQAG